MLKDELGPVWSKIQLSEAEKTSVVSIIKHIEGQDNAFGALGVSNNFSLLSAKR